MTDDELREKGRRYDENERLHDKGPWGPIIVGVGVLIVLAILLAALGG